MTTLTKFQRDAIREVENIGAGNASTALSKLLQRTVEISVPQFEIIPLRQLYTTIKKKKKLIVIVYTSISGDLQGNAISTIFSKEDALKIAARLQKRTPKKSTALTDKDLLILEKMGNILATSFLKSLTDFLGLRLENTNSRVLSIFGENITDFILLDIHKDTKNVLALHTPFAIPSLKTKGEFTLVIAIKSLPKLLQSIGRK